MSDLRREPAAGRAADPGGSSSAAAAWSTPTSSPPSGSTPEVYSGFAFGFGIDRLAQVRSGLADMRTLLDNDVRFLEQF